MVVPAMLFLLHERRERSNPKTGAILTLLVRIRVHRRTNLAAQRDLFTATESFRFLLMVKLFFAMNYNLYVSQKDLCFVLSLFLLDLVRKNK